MPRHRESVGDGYPRSLMKVDNTMRRLLLVLFVIVLIASPAVAQVGPVPQTLRDDWNVPDFYQKHLDVGGLPILGSAKVSDNAFREARWILQHMLEGREDILKTLADKHVHLAIMAYNEYTTDIPEHKRLRPRVYWDRRARGWAVNRSAVVRRTCCASPTIRTIRRTS